MTATQQVATTTCTKTGNERSFAVEIFCSWDEFITHKNDWDRLLAAMSEPSIFMTPEWLGSWWKAFGRDKEFMGMLFRDHQQQVVAIAPFYRQRTGLFRSRHLRLLGAGSGDSDALDFIVQPGAEAAVTAAFLNWLANNKEWAVCSLETLPKSSGLGHCLQQSLNQAGWSILSEESINYVVDLPATWQAYLQTLDPKFRPLLTRYPKRLHTRYQDARISRCEEVAELNAALEKLFELHQMRWTGRGEAGAFSRDERRGFYGEMAEAFLRRGWLEFWRLEIEGRTVATQFCFRYRDTVSLLQEGFDPKYAADKIGYALRAHVLETMIQSGARHYDFLGGSDSYKPKFGARAGSYLSLHFAGPSLAGRLQLAQKRRSKQARRWLKSNLPQRLLEALDRSGNQGAGA
jgi:CelD/BcsL family acetyltransferase involved in cellulose biosynthesis